MLIKFIGSVGRVTHVASVMRSQTGDVIQQETMNKTMYLLQQAENTIFFGDSTLIPEQADGLEKLIIDGAPDNVIDLRGAPLTEDAMNDMLLQIRDNFGSGTDAYFATGAFADLSKQIYERQRFTSAPQPGTLGAVVNAFQGQHGKINLHDSVFIQPGDVPLAAGLGNANKRPLPPTLGAPGTGADPASLFGAGDAGTYFYKIVAGNRFGLSAEVASASIAVSSGDKVSITITDGGQSSSYYEVYRTDPGNAVGTAKLILRVPATGGAQTFEDLNGDIPGTSKGFVLMQNQRSFSMAQLLPMTRIPLAAIDTSIRWAQLLYFGLKMYQPKKNLVIKNIGRTAGSLGT
jgi:hypothetical protein